ncbi:hypothetical protein AC1031_020824 [Aphanomyces cochlioides]|nr:hypothetical protein AC1031_020824 [Aphanomyces cochlioides]
MICLAYRAAQNLNNGFMTAWIVEMDFVQQIKDARERHLEMVLHPLGRTEEIEVADYICCKSHKLKCLETAHCEDLTTARLNNVWLLLDQWNQPCMDLVCLRWSREGIVLRVVQVSTAMLCTLNVEHIANLAKLLSHHMKLKIYGVEIFVVIPSDLVHIDMLIQGQISQWCLLEIPMKDGSHRA